MWIALVLKFLYPDNKLYWEGSLWANKMNTEVVLMSHELENEPTFLANYEPKD